MDGGAWWAAVDGVAKSQTRLKRLSSSSSIIDLQGFPHSSVGKESAGNTGHTGLIPGLGRCPGEGNGNPLQYSCLEKSHGLRSLAGHSPWSHKELAMTERLSHHHNQYLNYVSV